MEIFITGVTGFVGTAMARYYLSKGHSVTGVATRPEHRAIDHPAYRYIQADTTRPGQWQSALAGADAAINLAGRSIFHRWTDDSKKNMRDSRILTTRNVVAGLTDGSAPDGSQKVLCSASAVGFYGDRGEAVCVETSPAGDDFLARLSIEWEAEALRAEAGGIRVVVMRLGIALDRGGGAMATMLPAFKWGLGGKLGNGMQWFSWIHRMDLARAALFAIETPTMSGPVNFTAEPIRNADFTRALGEVLGRPTIFRVPAFAVRLALGELGGALFQSQRVKPERLTEEGFSFRYPEARSALSAIVAS